MTKKEYNGWTNYETWLVALWIDNEPATNAERECLAQDAWDNAHADQISTREQKAKYKLAESLKEWIEGMNPLADTADLFSDLLRAALSEVDWYDIAENFLDDVDKTEEDDEPEEVR